MEVQAQISLDFEGSNCEKKMMEHLLQLMDPEDAEEWGLPLDLGIDFPTTALVGPIKKDANGGYECDPECCPLAPELFATLFPASRFRYSVSLGYSGCCDNFPNLTAVFEDGKLMMREGYLYNRHDINGIAEICGKIYKTMPLSEEILEEFQKCYGISEELLADILENQEIPDDVAEEAGISWYTILMELTGSLEDELTLYEFRGYKPSRNSKYERSFFDGEDLQVYLVEEQMKNKDMSLAEYIKGFSFTEEQFQTFIQASAECGFDEMTAFLLEEKHRRFSEKE